MNQLRFSDLLNQIGTEIRDANARAIANDDKIMQFLECEIEIAVTAEVEGGGKINLYALEIGADASQTKSHTVKIKYGALEDNPQVNITELS